MTLAMAQRWIRFLAIAVGMTFVAFPLYWMLLTAFTPKEFLFRPPYQLVRFDLSLQNIRELLSATEFLVYLKNSLIVAAGAVVLNVVAATFAGYGLSRYEFRLKQLFAQGTLLSYMFPPILLAIPLFVAFSKMGLRGELWVLVFVYVAQTLPVCVYMLRNYFETVPVSLEEAAEVDGATRLQVIRKVTLPLAVPAIAATGLYVFMIAWNEFLFALLFLVEERNNWTVSLGVSQLTQIETPATTLMAGSVILTLPIIVLFLFAERLMTEGLTRGAEKG